MKDIPGWEELYSVTADGKVYSKRRNKYLAQHKVGRYWMVTLSNKGKRKTCLVHRLVAQAHIPNPDGYDYVLHRDDDADNNLTSNLRWGTLVDNQEDAKRNNRNAMAKRTHCKNGHNFDGIATTKKGNKYRTCSECNRIKLRRRRAALQ